MTKLPFTIESYKALVVANKTHVLQTLEGHSVRLLYTDIHRDFTDRCVVGYINIDGVHVIYDWNRQGIHIEGIAYRHTLKLVAKSEKSLGWIASYQKSATDDTVYVTGLYATDGECLANILGNGFKLVSNPIELFELN